MRGELVVPVLGGAYLRVDMADMVGRVLATSGIWEPNVTAIFRHLLSPGDVCLDVGAHIGYYTLLASKLVEPGGHVYALEPSPKVFARLDANLARNQAANVTALCLAASADDGSAFLRDPGPANSGAWTIVEVAEDRSALDGGDVVKVATRPLSSILEPEHHDRLRLVKIDVEGFEYEVLHGLGDVLGGLGRPAVLIELHPQAAVKAAIVLERLCWTYELRAYELPKPETYYDRFSKTASLRPVDLGSIREATYYNVLLAPVERVAGLSAEVE